MLDNPQSATVGISWVLKFGLDPIYSFGVLRFLATFAICHRPSVCLSSVGEMTRRLGLLRRSRSSKVTEFGTGRKLIMRLPILVINTNVAPILHRFRDIAFDRSKIAREDLRKILPGCQQTASVPNSVETLPKILIARVGCTNVTDRRQTTTYSEREREFTFANSVKWSENPWSKSAPVPCEVHLDIWNHLGADSRVWQTDIRTDFMIAKAARASLLHGQWREDSRSLAVAKRPRDCCVGQFWPNVTGRRHFMDIIVLSSTTLN